MHINFIAFTYRTNANYENHYPVSSSYIQSQETKSTSFL